jgi:GMP synthase (glutamine-hydrolysing)
MNILVIQNSELDPIGVLGACLGAQLIARAFGSQVYPHRIPEIGFSPIRVASFPAQEPWLKDCPEERYLMQWHFDTFDLPPQATLLMTNDICQNQAYRIGSNIYGFQFHLEVTPEIVMSWLALKNDWVEANYPHLEQQLEKQIQTYIRQSAQFAETVAEAWIELVPTPTALAP